MRFFLVDKVLELVPGERIKGVKCVTLTDEVLHDHFPDHPLMPGVLLVESCAQLAGFLLECTVNEPGKPLRRALLGQINKTKFHEAAGPGDRLELEVELSGQLESAAQVTFTVSCEGKRIARGGLTFFLKEIDSERVHEQRRYLYTLWTRDMNPAPTIL
jgi:3-hydroxyacyl-[acyl-carrier-protein] dehydratase